MTEDSAERLLTDAEAGVLSRWIISLTQEDAK